MISSLPVSHARSLVGRAGRRGRARATFCGHARCAAEAAASGSAPSVTMAQDIRRKRCLPPIDHEYAYFRTRMIESRTNR